jgi:hypothetical protein
MDTELHKDIKALFDYLIDDELENFWENCDEEHIFNSDNFDEWNDINKCTCEHNKNHIVKVLVRLDLKYDMFKNGDD